MKSRTGALSGNWQGGRYVGTLGYVWIWLAPGKRIQEHRFVMEKFLGRNLEKNEIVHHKNGKKTDNRLENLQLMKKGEHTTHHWTGRKHTPEAIEKNRQSNLDKKHKKSSYLWEVPNECID